MFSNIIFALRMSWRVSPLRFILEFIIKLLFRSYTVFYGVFFLGYVLNVVQEGKNITKVWLLIGVTICFMVAYDFLAAWYYNAYKPFVDQDVQRKYKKLIYDKASNVDIQCFENTYFYTNYTRASGDIIGRCESIFGDFLELIVDLIMNSYMFVTVFTLDSWSVVLCFIPIVIKYVVGKRLNKINYELYNSNIDFNRKKDYVKRTVYLKDYCKEIHTSNIFTVLQEMFTSASQGIENNIKKYGSKITLLSILNSSLITIFTYFIIIIYASYKALVVKNLSVGDYIILVNAVSRLSSMLVGFVDRIIRFNEHSRYIENIKAFLNIKNEVTDGELDTKKLQINTIDIKNVSFKYPGKDNYCLKNINMNICSGEKIAIVGLNGAGKTTLIKLLMRLYDVSKGEILLNGENIKKYRINDYRKIFSTVFQDYKIFASSIFENVMLDVYDNREEDIELALRNCGVLDTLLEKCNGNINNAVLTKEFDNEGVVLSGGQFQKIAIARAFIKRGGVAILDEPSSALDPVAEKQMFKNLLSACQDKIIIFISHRLSAAALADKIYVMNNGTIVECGTHEQLMKNHSIYYNMYTKQNKKFTNNRECHDE